MAIAGKKFLDKKLFGCLMENQDLGREEDAFSLKIAQL
jgi:hypothetical protein